MKNTSQQITIFPSKNTVRAHLYSSIPREVLYTLECVFERLMKPLDYLKSSKRDQQFQNRYKESDHHLGTWNKFVVTIFGY